MITNLLSSGNIHILTSNPVRELLKNQAPNTPPAASVEKLSCIGLTVYSIYTSHQPSADLPIDPATYGKMRL